MLTKYIPCQINDDEKIDFEDIANKLEVLLKFKIRDILDQI